MGRGRQEICQDKLFHPNERYCREYHVNGLHACSFKAVCVERNLWKWLFLWYRVCRQGELREWSSHRKTIVRIIIHYRAFHRKLTIEHQYWSGLHIEGLWWCRWHSWVCLLITTCMTSRFADLFLKRWSYGFDPRHIVTQQTGNPNCCWQPFQR